MEDSTSNNFARLLIFYDAIRRSKLNEQDLTKIVKKYENKPDIMISDLKTKYSDLYHFPPQVLLVDLQRILHVYSIPACLLALLPLPLPLHPYEPQIDMRSDSFNPDTVLHKGLMLITAPILPEVPSVPVFDNLSKLKYITLSMTKDSSDDSNKNGTVPIMKSSVRSAVHEMKASYAEKQNKHVDLKPLDRIALASSQHKASRDNSSGSAAAAVEDSPLVLLYHAMMQRRRVRVVIRRVNSIRGTVDGFVRGFDKHFNLLLTDVDEEYTPTPSPSIDYRRSSSTGSSEIINSSVADPKLLSHSSYSEPKSVRRDILARHLPQLLIRGDNVVLVCYRDKVAPMKIPASIKNK